MKIVVIALAVLAALIVAVVLLNSRGGAPDLDMPLF
jgi:hypothetical protein